MPQAEPAEVAKSRFLAAASHDLRQPLQTLALIHGPSAQTVEGERSRRLLARFAAALGAMSGALTTLSWRSANPGMRSATRKWRGFPSARYLTALAGIRLPRRGARRGAACAGVSREIPQPILRLLGRLIRILLADVVRRTSHGKILVGRR